MSLSLSGLAHADPGIRTSTPGQAFNLVRGGHGKVDDVAGGRRFMGEAFSTLVLTGLLVVPPAVAGSPKMLRLVVHFHTSPQGPRLTAVDVDGGIHIPTELAGNMEGESKVNTWDFSKDPIGVGARPSIRLTVVFPGGFDSRVNPGEFVLSSASVDFAGKVPGLRSAISGAATTTRLQPATGFTDLAPQIPSGDGQLARLDWCLNWGEQCGQPAADAYCLSKLRPSASAFQVERNVGQTVIIANKAPCTGPRCDGFSSISCAP